MNSALRNTKGSIMMRSLTIAFLALIILWPEWRANAAEAPCETLSCGPDMHCSSERTCQPGCIENFNCSATDVCVKEALQVIGKCQRGCQFSQECTRDAEKCDPDRHACVPGCDSSSCSAGKTCSNNQCIPVSQGKCSSAMDCQPTEFCNTITHECQVIPKRCSSDADCDGTEFCNSAKLCQVKGGGGGGGEPQLFCVASVPALIGAITDANKTTVKDTIVLQPGTYVLQMADNDTDGPNGLPDITSSIAVQVGECTSPGIGRATIQRADGAPPFRIFHVASSGTLSLENVTITGGLSSFSSDGGGGILNRGELTITNSTIIGNSTSTESTNFGGGGILNFGSMTLTNSTIAGNSSQDTSDGGGGILNSGSLAIIDSTIAGNQADNSFSGGGGILNQNRGQVTITNSTIARNRAVSSNLGGGGILNSGGTVIIKNTIVAQNVGSGVSDINSSDCRNSEASEGMIVNAGHNMSNGISCGFGEGDNIDPLLDTSSPTGLQENGGPTQTIALLPGSPAIDKGDNAACFATDQRGFHRPFGTACDIGAFEFGVARVNDLVLQGPVSTFSLPPAPFPPAIFFITVTFTNTSSSLILNPFFQVIDLSGGNLLLNADSGSGGLGVGATLTPNVGGIPLPLLVPGQSVTVTFDILLATPNPFTFSVNLLGVPIL